MDAVQSPEVDGLRKQNVRLLTENGELRKMMALMQENLELRYALRDHDNRARTLSPPPHGKDQPPPPQPHHHHERHNKEHHEHHAKDYHEHHNKEHHHHHDHHPKEYHEHHNKDYHEHHNKEHHHHHDHHPKEYHDHHPKEHHHHHDHHPKEHHHQGKEHHHHHHHHGMDVCQSGKDTPFSCGKDSPPCGMKDLMPGHRKLLESLTKLQVQDGNNNLPKDLHLQRMLADYIDKK
ncbi:histidine-rich glycoprotein-like isoform X2 [Rhinatrema bivittatum]|uniref:histidine-rich glycoprotein-like isoform X2 n=1 Tax=Rhinatrema bivittatum TaxID=194408 RepID=UPI00112BFB44|nr:histidine-rich glycoprotein-like isoform X2 [Rhinatrema bivittatum]